MKRWFVVLMLSLPVLFAVALAGFAGLVYLARNAPPSPAIAGEDWTHADLLNHLGKKGLKIEAHDGAGYGHGGPCMVFFSDQGMAFVSKTPSASYARDKAATLGGRGASWGRFLFDGDPKLIREIIVRLR